MSSKEFNGVGEKVLGGLTFIGPCIVILLL